jgi:uncharacterized protein YerC
MSFEPIDKRIQDYALSNWTSFCTLPGIDIKRATVCMLRLEGKTYGQISNIMGMSKSTVQRTLNKCVSEQRTVSNR